MKNFSIMQRIENKINYSMKINFTYLIILALMISCNPNTFTEVEIAGSDNTSDILNSELFSNTDEAEIILQKVAADANIDEFIIDDFIRVLDNPDIYDSLSAVEKRNLFRLLSEVPDLSDELFDGVLKTFNMDMDEINQIVYYLMQGPEKLTYLQSINKLFAEAPEVTPLIIKKHIKQFKDFKPSPSTVKKKLKLTPGEIEK